MHNNVCRRRQEAVTSATDVMLRHDDDVSTRQSDAAGPLSDAAAPDESSVNTGRPGDHSAPVSASPPPSSRRRRRGEADECLLAMKEDLGDWLGALHGVHVGADEFLEELETGVLLCRHANAVHDLLAQRTATDATAAARRRHDADDACKSSLVYVVYTVGETTGLFVRYER